MTSEIVGRGQCVAGAMPQWLLLHRRVVQHNLLWPVDLVVSSRVGAAVTAAAMRASRAEVGWRTIWQC